MIPNVLKPPVFPDSAATGAAHLLHRLLAGAFGVLTVLLVILSITLPRNVDRWLTNFIAYLAVFFCAVLFNHRGHTRVAAHLFLSFFTILIAVLAWSAGGIRSFVIQYFAAVVLAAGLLLGRLPGIIYGLVAALCGMGLIIMETQGMLPPISVTQTPVGIWAMSIGCISLLVYFVSLSQDNLNSALTKARHELDLRRKSESRLKSIGESFTAGMFYQILVQPDGTRQFTYLSDSVRQLYGISPQEGMQDANLIYGRVHPDDIEQIVQLEEQSRATMTTFRAQARLRNPSGDYRWVSYVSTPHRLDKGLCCWDGVEFIITEQKKTEEMLRQSEARLRTAQQLAHIGNWEVDLKTGLLSVSDEVLAIMEIPPGTHPLTLELFLAAVHPGDRAMMDDRYLASLQTRLPYSIDHRLQFGDGRVKYVQAQCESEFDAQGTATFSRGTIQGITERILAQQENNRLQDQLLQAQKMESIGQLASGVAHDFNNMLGGIMSAAELLEDESLSCEQRRHFIDLILQTTGQAADLTRKLLTFSRKSEKHLCAIDLLAAVNDTIAILSHTLDKKITLTLDNQASATTIMGDAPMLQNALLNMGINAGHAIPQGGTLRFELANCDLDRSGCEQGTFALTPGRHVRLRIRDTGCGMSPQVCRHIFEPFFTTKAPGQGTGLGLAAVYGTILDHQGAITVDSRENEGTEFTILLPCAASSQEPAPKIPTAIRGRGSILIIDDEIVIRTTARSILGGLGYSVTLAENGRQGIELFIAMHDRLDAVILDMIMPDMNGREVFEQLQKIDPAIPVLLCSGFTHEEDLARLHETGLAGFIRKPFRTNELSRMLASILEKR